MDPRAAPLSTATRRRPHCARCALPQATCVCARAVPLTNHTPVLILQHPAEARHAKGTATLLRLSLTDVVWRVGEILDVGELSGCLRAGAALLYPADSGSVTTAVDTPTQLVVLDGTWRQSRRMLADNPLLQQLPRWSLHDTPPSRYAVRRAHRAGQLSTLEATVLALQDLDGASPAHDTLLASFEGHVAALLARHRPGPGQA